MPHALLSVAMQGFVAAALEHFWSSGSGLKDDKHLRPGLDGCDQGHTGSRHITANGRGSPPAILQELRSNGHLHSQNHQQHMPPCHPGTSEVSVGHTCGHSMRHTQSAAVIGQE